MEDIKILEEIIELYRSSNELPYKFNGNIMQAIENLINRNKELEEENRRFKRIDEIVDNMTVEEIDTRIKEDEEKFIPKSKVETKKEEYKKLLMSCNRFSDVDRIKAINERILVCDEILENRR